ncbi:MAG TPA: cyclic pyranopterin monophosphate synthase MoaC [Vicinamibacterales bacterium]|jgi:cyclic pyranopterin phosphate synthase
MNDPRKLTHVDSKGRARMVDVGGKTPSAREAVARGRIAISAEAAKAVRSGRTKKGDPLETARLAGIMAAKQTSALIPLCHPLALSFVDVQIAFRARGYDIEARVRTNGPTGVEMEALTAVSVAALTLYDMLKAIDKGMVIGSIRLIEKRGGKSGTWRAGDGDEGRGTRDGRGTTERG